MFRQSMLKSYILSKSYRPDKKWMVISDQGNVIHFGQSGYEDYTIHKDDKRRINYLSRHKNDDFYNLDTPATWAKWILWTKPNLKDAIKNMEQIFNIKITLNPYYN